MRGKRQDDRLEQSLLREVLDAMNFMTYLWLRGGKDMPKAELVRLEKRHNR